MLCIFSMAWVRPSLNLSVASAGEPGGESAPLASSCKRYLIGENAFRGLVDWLGGAGGELGRPIGILEC